MDIVNDLQQMLTDYEYEGTLVHTAVSEIEDFMETLQNVGIVKKFNVHLEPWIYDGADDWGQFSLSHVTIAYIDEDDKLIQTGFSYFGKGE